MSAIYVGLLVVSFLSMVGVQEEGLPSELGKCAKLTDSLQRLQCYDKVAAATLSGQPAGGSEESEESEAGSWMVQVKTNPVDDSKTVILGKTDENEKVFLVLRCMQNKPSVFINWRDYLGSDGPRVLTRLGNAEAKTKTWDISTDKTSTFYRGDKANFINELLQVNKFVAQVTPYNESPVTAVFDMTGLPDVIGELKQTCNLE